MTHFLFFSTFEHNRKYFEKYNGKINGLVTKIHQNIFFCVLQKKVSHSSLEEQEGE